MIHWIPEYQQSTNVEFILFDLEFDVLPVDYSFWYMKSLTLDNGTKDPII